MTAAAARRRGASDRSVAIILAFGYVTGLANTVIRAQIWTYVLFAALLALLLSDVRRPSRRVFLVFPLLILWANLHGSVVVGAAPRHPERPDARGQRPALPGPRQPLVARRRARRTALALHSGLALRARAPGYYRGVLDNPTLSQSVSGVGGTDAARAGGLLHHAARRHLAGDPVALGVDALRAARALVDWAPRPARDPKRGLVRASSPPRSSRPRSMRPGHPRVARRTRVNLALAGAAIAAAVISLAGLASHDRAWWERGYPPQALAAVARAAKQDPSARVFANERYADWLLFYDPALRGRVAYDIRFELLPTKTFTSIVTFRSEHGYDWRRSPAATGCSCSIRSATAAPSRSSSTSTGRRCSTTTRT